MVSALLTLVDLWLCVLVGGMESAEALFFFFLYKRSNRPSMILCQGQEEEKEKKKSIKEGKKEN